jgi:hypothetical protein
MTMILIAVVSLLLCIVGLAIFLQDPREVDEEAAQEAAQETDEEIRRALYKPPHILTPKELDEENEREVDAQR